MIDKNEFCEWLVDRGWKRGKLHWISSVINKKLKEINWQIHKYEEGEQDKEETVSKVKNIAHEKPQVNPTREDHLTHDLRKYIMEKDIIDLEIEESD